MTNIKTPRLILRKWQKSDWDPFAALNADPRVMEYFVSTLSRKESDDLAERICVHLEKHGWGLWAASLIETKQFIGFIGLREVPFQAHFTPAIEIGWRLSFDYWDKGYATEGAKAVLHYGFEILNLNQIVSFTTISNIRSRNVMKKIGMHHNPNDDFDHPLLSQDHPLKRHVLYHLNRQEWHL